MCLLIVLSRVLPDWPLVVAANRDERYDRPAESLVLLRSTAPRTLGGRDLLAGGTWLAANERGVVAGLTNKPAPEGRDVAKRSRGEIPLALTEHDDAPSAATAFGTSAPRDFNPCWVLVGDRTSLFSLDMTQGDEVRSIELPPGIHILENKPLDQASAKVDYVSEALAGVAGRPGDEVLGLLQRLLADHTITNPAPDDGEDAQRRAQASACCVHADGYGTRSSMLVRLHHSDAVPEVWASDGPSCTNPMRRATSATWGGPLHPYDS